MSRDFMATQQGREFRESPNRDRLTRGQQSYPFYSSIRYISTRWGAYEWCLGTASGPALNQTISSNRYRKIRIIHEWDSSGPISAGRREDLVDYGDGLSDPSAGLIHGDPPFDVDYPTYSLAPIISATATEIRRLAFVNANIPLVRIVMTLEDPEDVKGAFAQETYQEFGNASNFRHRTRIPPTDFFGFTFPEIYDDRSYWTRGPMTWRTEPDINLPGTIRAITTQNITDSPSLTDAVGGIVLEHFPSATRQFVELGYGSKIDIHPIPNPPVNGAVAKIYAATNNSVISKTVSPIPGALVFPAGAIKISDKQVLNSFFWQIDLVKINMQANSGLIQRYARGIGNPPVGFTQFSLGSESLTGGILQPPTADQITYYGLNNQAFYYSRKLIPPYSQSS